MKIHKIYENKHTNATKLTELISKTFFQLDEFEKVYYESDDGERFRFYICFVEIFKETVEQMEKFNVFFSLIKDGWSFKIDTEKNVIYEEFHLTTKFIDKYLDKFEMLKKSEKYNL